MSAHKNIDKICIIALIVTLLITALFMNGEKLGVQVVADQDAETYAGDEYFSGNDLDGTWDASSATVITLEGGSAKVSGSGAYAYDGNVYIVQSGYYEISGELTDGSIIVDAEDYSKVWILLDGVTVSCSDDACIRVEEADKTFLTLAEGSENTLTGGAEYSEEALEDGTGGVIYAHDDLTINGNGSLTVTASYQHGIEANDELTITGGMITVEAPADGLHVNEAFAFTGADLTITAGDDAIHSDTAVYVLGGSIQINDCCEGIEARIVEIYDGEITISASDDGINANGGSGTGFGMGMGRMDQMGQGSQADAEDSTAEKTEDEETYILIAGGSITILNSDGRDADGIDSNGDLYITGGSIFVSMTGTGGNSAIDVASENGGTATISGGTLAAFGGSSMMESFDSSSEQCSLVYFCSGDAGTAVSLLDEDGTVLLSYEVPYAFSAVTLSSPDLQSGRTYTITVGGASEEITLDGAVTSTGTSQGGQEGMMSGFGGMGREELFGGPGSEDSSGFPDAREDSDTGGENSSEGDDGAAFGGRHGRRQGGGKGGMTPPAADSSDGSSGSQGFPETGEDGEMPEMPSMSGGGERPEMPGTEQEAAEETAVAETPSAEEILLLCGVSVIVLAGGILTAWRHRSFRI